MSVASAVIYGWSQDLTVLWLTAGMYAVGLAYYFGYAKYRLTHSAPEEIAARRALEGLSADETPLPLRDLSSALKFTER